MKRKRILPINKINLIIIITAMIIVALLNQNIIKTLSERDIRNVIHLTEAHIYGEITEEFAEPVNTSLIMAQNTLLIDLMDGDDPETASKIANYLAAIQASTGYESVFLVPHSTLNYYFPGGTVSKVDLDAPGSEWYKACMSSRALYTLNVNEEQLDDDAMTVYVNANIYDGQGKFIGLTGVGKRLFHLQEILGKYTVNQGVEAYLVSEDGKIQVHSNPQLIHDVSIYDYEGVKDSAYPFLTGEESVLEHQVGQKIILTHQVHPLGWYLVVSKSRSELSTLFYRNTYLIYGALVLAATIMMGATSVTIARYRKQIIQLSNTDVLTDIPNRTIFDQALKSAVRDLNKLPFTLVLFDLDDLKGINDSRGHDVGDYVLREIAGLANDLISQEDVLARIGGDEFGVVMHQSLETTRSVMASLIDRIQADGPLQDLEASISIGIGVSQPGDTESMIFKRADEALYLAKTSGKAKIICKS